MFDMTGFQRDCLFVIASLTEPKGVDVKRELDSYYVGEINYGRLYPNLDELVDEGLVEKGSIDDRTNAYTLTARGKRELEARRNWEDTLTAEQSI